MDEAAFWAIIDRARGEGAGPLAPSADPEALRAILEGESDEAVRGFAVKFGRQLDRLNEWRVWGAGYVIYEGMSGDSFHYFRAWLVGKGKAAVEQALTDPDGLGPFVDDPEEVDNELLEYVPVEVCEARGLPDPRDGYERDADDDPRGEPFDEETVDALYPRLAARFGEGDQES